MWSGSDFLDDGCWNVDGLSVLEQAHEKRAAAVYMQDDLIKLKCNIL